MSMLVALVASLAHSYLEDGADQLPVWFADTIAPAVFAERIGSPEFLNLVCEDAAAIVGYISIKGGSHLYHLFVSEASQGKGIASRLWRRARELTSSSHYSVRSSLNAVPVYTKFGFHNVGPIGCKDGIRFQPMDLQINQQ